MIEFDRLDRQHKPTLVLRLLAANQISVGKACQWLNDYQQDEIIGDLPEWVDHEEDFRAAADRRDEKVRELVEAAEDFRRYQSATSADRLDAAIAAVRSEYTTDKGEPR